MRDTIFERRRKRKEQKQTRNFKLEENVLCKINSCTYFDTCDKKQLPNDKVKCINYKKVRI